MHSSMILRATLYPYRYLWINQANIYLTQPNVGVLMDLYSQEYGTIYNSCYTL